MASEAWAAAALLLALVALPLAAGSPLAADTHVLTSEKPGGFGYVSEQVLVDVAGTLTLTNLDLRAHDVVALVSGPDTNPWCPAYKGPCPLFASPLVGLGGQASVEGIWQLAPLASYPFYCSIHPWMTGTLTAI